jgi:hypothetical protein
MERYQHDSFIFDILTASMTDGLRFCKKIPCPIVNGCVLDVDVAHQKIVEHYDAKHATITAQKIALYQGLCVTGIKFDSVRSNVIQTIRKAAQLPTCLRNMKCQEMDIWNFFAANIDNFDNYVNALNLAPLYFTLQHATQKTKVVRDVRVIGTAAAAPDDDSQA